MSESNPVSTAIRRCFAATEKECLDAVQERDTYRDLCVELIGIIKEHMNYVDLSIHIEFKDAITKAESILGEKNGNAN